MNNTMVILIPRTLRKIFSNMITPLITRIKTGMTGNSWPRRKLKMKRTIAIFWHILITASNWRQSMLNGISLNLIRKKQQRDHLSNLWSLIQVRQPSMRKHPIRILFLSRWVRIKSMNSILRRVQSITLIEIVRMFPTSTITSMTNQTNQFKLFVLNLLSKWPKKYIFTLL